MKSDKAWNVLSIITLFGLLLVTLIGSLTGNGSWVSLLVITFFACWVILLLATNEELRNQNNLQADTIETIQQQCCIVAHEHRSLGLSHHDD